MTRTTKTPTNSRRRRNAWGTTQQLPSGRYRAFYRHDGQRFSAPETFESKAEALTWLAMQQADIARGVWVDPRPSATTLTEYAFTWLAGKSDIAPRTRELYEQLLRKWILPPLPQAGDQGQPIELGAMPLNSITPQRIRTWHAALTAAAARSATARRRGGRDATDPKAKRAHPARAWGRSIGMDVPTFGRLDPKLLAAWRRHGSPIVEPAPKTPAPGAGRVTAVKAYSLLRTICNDAVRDEAMRANPCRIPGAGNYHPQERTPATAGEVEQLAAAMPDHLAVAVTLAAWSGLRFGELFALAREHVDLAAGTVRVERALQRLQGQPVMFSRPKTRKSIRTVHLPAFVVEELRDHMAKHTADRDDALLFTHKGRIVTTSALTPLFKAARQTISRDDLTWHDLRHTGATLAYRAGASVPDVQRRLGHTTVRAAMIYAHAADESDRDLAAKLHNMFGSAA